MMVVMVMKTMMVDRAGVTMLTMVMVMMMMMMDRAGVMGDHLAAAPRANCCGAEIPLFPCHDFSQIFLPFLFSEETSRIFFAAN